MNTFEFDTTHSAISGERVDVLYIPSVEDAGWIDVEGYDVLIDGKPDNLSDGWRALIGYTRQYGYRGAIMHPSETMTDDAIRGAVLEAGGDVFAIVAVEVPCGYCESGEPSIHTCEIEEPAGWAIIYRSADA